MTTKKEFREWLGWTPQLFKVWGQIEAQGNPDKDEYENVGEPVTVGTFDTIQEAERFLSTFSTDGFDSEGKVSAADLLDMLKRLTEYCNECENALEHEGVWGRKAPVREVSDYPPGPLVIEARVLIAKAAV